MKWSWLIFLFFLIQTSCSTEFDPYIEATPTPVVYGMLNPADSIYSIRLTKSFVGPGNAYDYARIADSLYYQDAQVWLETRTYDDKLIERVDLVPTIIADREPGIFASTDNMVYQTTNQALHLNPEYFEQIGKPYRARVHVFAQIPGEEELIHSSSPLQLPPRITQPHLILNRVYLYTDHPFFMEWLHDWPDNTFEITVRMNYTEFFEDFEEETFTEWVLKGINVNTVSIPPYGERKIYSYHFRPENFYAQIAANIEPNPDVKVRVARTLEFTLFSSDNHIRFYQQINKIADDYRGAGYSNIDNGTGIFSTYTSVGIKGLQFGIKELDSLAMGHYTKHLKFTRWH